MTEKQVFKTTWGGRPLEVEIGQLAKKANGAVLVRYGDTVVLSAAVASKEAKDVDFFPLTVNYEEKMYAVSNYEHRYECGARLYTRNGCNVWVFLSVSNFRYSV